MADQSNPWGTTEAADSAAHLPMRGGLPRLRQPMAARRTGSTVHRPLRQSTSILWIRFIRR